MSLRGLTPLLGEPETASGLPKKNYDEQSVASYLATCKLRG